jgi:peptidoglycan biosynthesis protein MviN/MurJ (putative lipid II flippase)
MLWWLVLGLLPAGIGAMLLSPLVVSRGIDVLFRRGAAGRERRRAWVAILMAGLLGLIGMVFSLLLAIHLVR